MQLKYFLKKPTLTASRSTIITETNNTKSNFLGYDIPIQSIYETLANMYAIILFHSSVGPEAIISGVNATFISKIISANKFKTMCKENVTSLGDIFRKVCINTA